MFSKIIFKQTLKANFKIWFLFTLILCVLNMVLIAVFNPTTISSVTDLLKDTPLSALIGMTTFLGMLAQTFYGLQGILLPLVFIIITANSLIASQVDRGSMAYLLSTPTKRSVVVRTQAAYFITSLFAMLFIITIVGLFSVQAFQGCVWGKGYTEDIKAVSKVLDIDEADIEKDLTLILEDANALKVGAQAREMDEEVYSAYLRLKIAENANEAPDEEMQNKVITGLTAAAAVLGVEESDLASDMGKIKDNQEALEAAVNASGIPQAIFLTIINNQLAMEAVASDKGIDFSIHDYIMLNLGLFLLMFAISSVSFLFSCIFNLSKNYMALGAGIPIAFFIFKMMGQTSDSLEAFKYLSLNSLFDTAKIINGEGFLVEFIALAMIGIVLYVIGMKVFKEKDLPL